MSFLASIAVLALAFPAGATAAVPWENGEPPIVFGDEVEAPCGYCSALQGTITGPADGVAFQAASSPLEKGYAHMLNSPCMPLPGAPCPEPLYSGAVEQGLSASWFVPETNTYRVWALREAGTCTPHFTPPFYTETPGCQPDQEVCSPSVTVTLPATVSVACLTTHAARSAIRRQRRRRR